MEINFSLPREITANVAKRTITGLIAPFNEVGFTNAGEVIFKRGVFGDIQASAIKLLADHEMSRPIGKMVAVEEKEEGIYATFKLGSSTRATDALIEASEGLKNGLSVGASIVDYETDKQGRLIVTAAKLKEVSLVTEPAFAEARVLEVAASATPTEEEKEEPMSEPTKEEVVEAAPAVEAAAPQVEAAKPTVALAYTKPRHGITTAAAYLEHKIKAATGNFESQTWVLAADDTAGNTGLTLPQHLQEFITTSIDGRPAVEAVSTAPLIDNGMSFTIPKLSTAPTIDNNSTENEALGGTEMASNYVTVDVKKAAGLQTISWELLDRSSPSFYNELLRELNFAYAKATDQALVSALIANGTQAGTQAATIAGLKSYIAASVPAAYSAAGRFARNLVVNTSWWETIIGAEDTTNRPLFIAAQPQNSPGAASPTSLTGTIMGLNLYVDPHMSITTKIDDSAFIIVPEAQTFYESPRTTVQVQALANGQVQVAVYGYYAIANKVGAGIRRFNLT